MIPHNYDEAETDRQFDDLLKRDHSSGNQVGIGTIIHVAQQNGYVLPHVGPKPSAPASAFKIDLDQGTPTYHPTGVPPREFVGPEIGGRAKLFPLNAISILAALGGSGKTTLIMKMAAHIAAGKQWGSSQITRRRVLLLNIEENKQELDRKYGAAVHGWSDQERLEASEALRLISCVGSDARLTRFNNRQVDSTPVVDEIIRAAKEFDAQVIFIDHLQGFVSGDLNASDTATALSRVANRIVSKTGAAVVLAAHIAKANIGAQSVEAGVVTGSLAHENATRQVVGIINVPDDDAKKYGLEAIRENYMKLEISKNSYGPAGGSAYLQKLHVPAFHTVTVEPFHPTIAVPVGHMSKDDRLKQALIAHITSAGRCSQTDLDGRAGTKGQFKASRANIRKTLEELVDQGEVIVQEVSQSEAKDMGLPRQTKKVYRIPQADVGQ